MKAAVLGYGYWGKNITRNFVNILGINNVVIYDPDEKALINARATHLGIEVSNTAEELFSRSDIDIIAVVTPVSTHYDLGLRALKAGKHLFLEKPMTQWTWQAEELIEEARKQGLIIMVDHTFLFTGAVQKIKEIVEEGVLGEIIYFDSYRVNLGLFQHDVNVIYDLAPHDISILNHLVHKKPIYLQAEGFDFINNGLESVAYLTLKYRSFIAHFNMSWLSPVKIRHIMVAGTKKMLVWNDLNPDEPVKVYDKGIEMVEDEDIHQLLISYRSGDVFSPKIVHKEALKSELEYFLACINTGTQPEINSGEEGLAVVKILEASNESIRLNQRMDLSISREKRKLV